MGPNGADFITHMQARDERSLGQVAGSLGSFPFFTHCRDEIVGLIGGLAIQLGPLLRAMTSMPGRRKQNSGSRLIILPSRGHEHPAHPPPASFHCSALCETRQHVLSFVHLSFRLLALALQAGLSRRTPFAHITEKRRRRCCSLVAAHFYPCVKLLASTASVHSLARLAPDSARFERRMRLRPRPLPLEHILLATTTRLSARPSSCL